MFHCSCFSSKVIYGDGDQEILNLTKERWELVDNDNASDPVGSCQAFLLPSLLYPSVLCLSLFA